MFSSLFLRAFRICSPEYIDHDVNKIYGIAIKLKYPKWLTDKSLKKARATFYSNDPKEPFLNKNILTLPFHPKFLEIPRLLKIFNINVIFRNSSTIKNLLLKNSPTTSAGCIYQIPCKGCNSKYIGQTGKDLAVRLSQHKYCVRTGNNSNALFIHMNDYNHAIDWNNAKEILFVKSFVNRNILESCLIKASSSIMNISPGLFKLDKYIIDAIIKQLRFTF